MKCVSEKYVRSRNQTLQNISECKDIQTKYIQMTNRKIRPWKINSIGDLWKNIKQSNIHVPRVSHNSAVSWMGSWGLAGLELFQMR